MELSYLFTGKRQAISSWFRKFTTVIDLEKKLFMERQTVLGLFKFGLFQTLPKIDYVLIFRQFFTKCESCTFDDEDGSAYYQLSFVHHKCRRIIVSETLSRQEAFMSGSKLAAELNVRLKDASQKGMQRWVPNGCEAI